MTTGQHPLRLLAAYVGFGVLHELAHIIAARLFYPKLSLDFLHALSRAALGRYCALDLPAVGSSHYDETARLIIRHAGWIFSVFLAIAIHLRHRFKSKERGSLSSKIHSGDAILVAAWVTALEAVATDLFGLVPATTLVSEDAAANTLIFFCGNFGVLLLNSTWINVDGGKRALDMLEKMIEVTMMRGAQSGGVVTYEPAPSSGNQTPQIKGVRSRVVNSKRTNLSKGVRAKVVVDNSSFGSSNLRGYNSPAFNANSTAEYGNRKHLVRGFFGHTRFATTSKASMDGTHPHQWSPRKDYTFYPFQSATAAKGGAGSGGPGGALVLKPKSEVAGIENYVTHNGDFEFYNIKNKYYDTEAIQNFLVRTLQVPMPATVDSAAIAGMMDLLRTQGSFALSVRYAICFRLNDSPMGSDYPVPSAAQYETFAEVFERKLDEFVASQNISSLEEISSSKDMRESLIIGITKVFVELTSEKKKNDPQMDSALDVLINYASFDPESGDIGKFVGETVAAFFDNDLLHSLRTFLENAKGSFGLSVTCSVDAKRQAVFAAKGQTLSVAFYPRRGVICFGSEQAAVKAGLNYEVPEGTSSLGGGYEPVDENAVRLDLDDLGGEICLLDWGYAGDVSPAVSPPNRGLVVNKLMGGAVSVILLHQQAVSNRPTKLQKRLVQLEQNEFIKPLLDDSPDPILQDIRDIPKICNDIQEDWKDVGLNRMTAWHLGQCIQKRLQGRVDGSVKTKTNEVDILVTGCEVSLWLAEQFCADLLKCFPQLGIKAVSSNKLLGLFGQELSMPCIGFPYTKRTLDMTDPIVIIVSHSGGTFGPLACSNLMQSFSSSIFAVTSEWDTQVGKQLRSMYHGGKNDLLTSRIFSTEVGVRPAEPCSVSVAATHQLLTNIFEHICLTIISKPAYRAVSGAIVNERDLQTLERCNQDNIKALERIVAVDRNGVGIHERLKSTEEDLRSAGDLWAEHILENVKAYIMTFFYIIVTVTIGYPLISGIAYGAGLNNESVFYFLRFLDALVYFWLPQINVFILRFIQGRNMRHRMVGRTVVVGDPCPWVAQSAEAFLGKIFACSYSIAGCNVLSGNPADHLVHRHTHRVVRGSLLVCGRPDGRLTALTTSEASTCLAVNQASSIQSLGGTCESITIGHNWSELPLAERAIFLESFRPLFLCERMLTASEEGTLDSSGRDLTSSKVDPQARKPKVKQMKLTATGNLQSSGFTVDKETQEVIPQRRFSMSFRSSSVSSSGDDISKRSTSIGTSLRKSFIGKGSRNHDHAADPLKHSTHRSSASLLGAYANLEKEAKQKVNSQGVRDTHHLDSVIRDMIKEKKSDNQATEIFHAMDVDGSGELDLEEFTTAYKKINPNVSLVQLEAMFQEADLDDSGTLDLQEFLKMVKIPDVDVLGKLGVQNRNERGLVSVMPSTERYFGEELRRTAPKGVGAFLMSQSQQLAMELYESRIASMQRFVAMTVMFHQMGDRVQSFFPKISFGLLGYRMDRTHSIMRIATTASPVSGADVRDQMVELHLRLKIEKAVNLVIRHFNRWKAAKNKRELAELRSSMTMSPGSPSMDKIDEGSLKSE